jgi:ATP-dependent DNA ligase
MRVLVTRKQHVNNMSHQIIKDGGEGVILRQPASEYEHGRSAFLIKLKVLRPDLPFSRELISNSCFYFYFSL